MANDLAKPSIEELREREERRALKRQKRQGKLDDFLLDVKYGAVADVRLRQFVGLSDPELRRKGLTDQEIYKVHQWELPKKSVAYSLEASAQFTTSMLRREGEKAGVTINVENMQVLQLPEKKPETVEPVVIDITVDK